MFDGGVVVQHCSVEAAKLDAMVLGGGTLRWCGAAIIFNEDT